MSHPRTSAILDCMFNKGISYSECQRLTVSTLTPYVTATVYENN